MVETDCITELEDKSSDYRKFRLKLAIGFCLFLFFLQLVGGWISNSLALMADAFHMLSDVIGYVISLGSIILAVSPSTVAHPFGRKRLEVLGTLRSFNLKVLLLAFLSCGYLRSVS